MLSGVFVQFDSSFDFWYIFVLIVVILKDKGAYKWSISARLKRTTISKPIMVLHTPNPYSSKAGVSMQNVEEFTHKFKMKNTMNPNA